MSLRVISMHAAYATADGGVVDGYLSRPVENGPWPSVVMCHSYRGLNEVYRELSRQLAGEGFVVLVPDLYEGRTTSSPTEAALLKTSLDFDGCARHLADAVPYLRGLPYTTDRVGITGHCLGGGLTLLTLARNREFACGVVYYHSVFPDERDLQEIRTPILGHFGDADPFTPAEAVQKLQACLEAAGQAMQVEWYPGMGHAFANLAEPEPGSREAIDRAWRKTAEFFHAHLTAGAGEGSGHDAGQGESKT